LWILLASGSEGESLFAFGGALLLRAVLWAGEESFDGLDEVVEVV
jgi:hypothetical protein